MTVIVYSTSTCPYCDMAKKFLKQKNIPFQEVNVGENRAAAMEMVKKSGQMGVPVLDIDGTIVIGFDEEAIRKALKL